MVSPLEEDAKLLKEFGIDEKKDLEPLFKLSYVRAQIDEFKKAMFRNRVDALISMDLIARAKAAKDEPLETKARENLTNYRNFIKQTAGALLFLEGALSELESAHPNAAKANNQ